MIARTYAPKMILTTDNGKKNNWREGLVSVVHGNGLQKEANSCASQIVSAGERER